LRGIGNGKYGEGEREFWVGERENGESVCLREWGWVSINRFEMLKMDDE